MPHAYILKLDNKVRYIFFQKYHEYQESAVIMLSDGPIPNVWRVFAKALQVLAYCVFAIDIGVCLGQFSSHVVRDDWQSHLVYRVGVELTLRTGIHTALSLSREFAFRKSYTKTAVFYRS